MSILYTIFAHASVFLIVMHLMALVFSDTKLPHPKIRRLVVAIAVTYLFWFFT